MSLISNMLSECPIDVVLDTDWDRIHGLQSSNQIVVYTGPIDSFFQFKYGRLKWRTLDFEIERIGINDYQGNSVINFPDESIPYTRIHEFKHLHPQRTHTKGETIIMREFSRFAREGDEPFYPVNSTDDRTKLILYRNECKKLNRTIFGGRLGSYKYLDMHMAIASAFQVYSNHIRPKLVG